MKITLPINIEPCELAEHIYNSCDNEQIMELIKALDLSVAEVDFTTELMRHLYSSLIKDGFRWTPEKIIDLDDETTNKKG